MTNGQYALRFYCGFEKDDTELFRSGQECPSTYTSHTYRNSWVVDTTHHRSAGIMLAVIRVANMLDFGDDGSIKVRKANVPMYFFPSFLNQRGGVDVSAISPAGFAVDSADDYCSV